MDKLNQLNIAVHQLLEHGNLDLIDSVFSENYVAHWANKSYQGHKFIVQFTKQLRKAIPDLKILKLEFLSQTDNVVTWQRTFSGTHRANLKGIPASNKKVKWCEMVVSRFHDNKIEEEWVVSDLASQLMLKQKRST